MGPDRRSPSGEPWDLPEYEAIVRDLADKLRRVGALNDVLQTAVDEIEGARAALRQERGQLDRVVGELDAASAETRRAAAHLGRLDPGGLRERVDRVEPALTTLLQERLAEVERTVTTGLAGLAPLLAAAHDEATRAAEAAAAAGRQAAEAAAATGQRTADAAAESGRLALSRRRRRPGGSPWTPRPPPASTPPERRARRAARLPSGWRPPRLRWASGSTSPLAAWRPTSATC
jgi:ABC-type transporter Mla subunit MlaD